MELTELKKKIISYFSRKDEELEKLLETIENDESVFPFNEYEHLLTNFISNGDMKYDDYLKVRYEYIRKNPNLYIFEITSPRAFGERFAETYIKGKCSKLQKPDKNLDPKFNGEYDLWLDGIKIEVKASRVQDSSAGKETPLYMKALSRNTDSSFLMNFQQLKPSICHVFVWLAVFRDQIVIWVMSSSEVENHQLFSHGQHRGNQGEGQLHIKNDNIHLFNEFELKDDDIEKEIKKAYNRL